MPATRYSEGTHQDPRRIFRRPRSGTAQFDPITGHKLPGEINEYGRPIGSGSGVVRQLTPNTMTKDADWRAMFPRGGSAAPAGGGVASSIATPSPEPAANPLAPVVMGGTRADAFRLLTGKPSDAGPALAEARDNPGRTVSTPYGEVAVTNPFRRPASTMAAAPAPIPGVSPTTMAAITPSAVQSPMRAPEPSAPLMAAATAVPAARPVTPAPAPKPAEPIPFFQKAGKMIGGAPSAVDSTLDTAVTSAGGAMKDFRRGLHQASPTVGKVWDTVVEEPLAFANRGANWLRNLGQPTPPDFPPAGQPGGRPGGTGGIAGVPSAAPAIPPIPFAKRKATPLKDQIEY